MMLSDAYFLRSEVQRLHSEILRLETENQSLRAEIETLRDVVAEFQSCSRDGAATPPWQDPALIIQVKQWLGEKGIKTFRNIRDHHDGALNVVIMEKGTPLPVHFREGTLVRNYLRRITNGAWSDWEYDDHWEEIVLEAIR